MGRYGTPPLPADWRSVLDGQTLDATGWTDAEIRGGSYEVVDGWADRADYEPDEGGDPLVWQYRGPVPG